MLVRVLFALSCAQHKAKKLFVSLALLCLVSGLHPAFAQVNVLTYHNDNFRSGANLQETILNTSNVKSSLFGRRFSFPVDDWIVGQPLYVSNVATACGTLNLAIVATLNNSVYAFSADGTNPCASANQAVWFYHNNAEPPTSFANLCHDSGYQTSVHGGAGIVGTPVIDNTSQLVYFVTKTTLLIPGTGDKLFLHVIDLATGGQTTNQQVEIVTPVLNVSYLPLFQMSRPGVLLDKANNLVYVTLGSTGCKSAPNSPPINNHGFVIAYSTPGLSKQGAFATTPTTNNGGVWQTGGGPVLDGSGAVYVSTAEQAAPMSGDFGNSILKLTNKAATLSDFFTPFNVALLDSTDNDIGSVGPIAIDDNLTTPAGQYLIASGKPSEIYLLNRNNLGKFCTDNCTTNSNIVEDILAPSDIRTSCQGGGAGQACRMASPAYWNTTPNTSTANGFVYFSQFNDNLFVYSLTHGSGVSGDCTVNHGPVMLSCGPAAETNVAKPVSFLPPSISANCSSTGGCVANTGILWVITRSSAGATLRAFDATPPPPSSSAVLQELFNSDTVSGDALAVGSDVDHFATVTVANGRVYVGTHKELVAYGLEIVPTAGKVSPPGTRSSR